jgi:hypothetical protein
MPVTRCPGRLTIEMENAHLNPSYAHRNGGLEAGDYAAIISVSDTCVGSLRKAEGELMLGGLLTWRIT